VRAQAHLAAAGACALLACLSGCGYLTATRPSAARTLTLPAAAPSVLIVITDPDSPTAMRETSSLVAATARTREKFVILDDHTGAVLATSTAPAPLAAQVPAPPASLPDHATSFQKARHDAAVRQYDTAVQDAEATAKARQQDELVAWARQTVASAQAGRIGQDGHDADINASLGAAAADLASLHQIGVPSGTSAVIAIVGIGQAITPSVPEPPGSLQASTVVVDGFPDSSTEEAAWQSSLLQAGATRVMLLTGATDDQLPFVVGQALDGTITDTLTNVLFGLGQYKLTAAALPQLRQLLQLLTVRYPDATTTIVGYTDDLPTPGGNVRLSQLRAEAVEQWLIAHGVASDRLQAFGYGDVDPIAPNMPTGQPLDRRVDVIIDPTLP
jgi:outer membrane protein OmpA-like peptidoglycan-associated protein